MWRTLACLASIVTLGAAARAEETVVVHAAPKPACFNAGETREEIKTHHLMEPFAALKSAQAQFKAEALSARLCRLGDEYIYEIALLHRDGRYVHVAMNANTGKSVDSRRPREPAPKP